MTEVGRNFIAYGVRYRASCIQARTVPHTDLIGVRSDKNFLRNVHVNGSIDVSW